MQSSNLDSLSPEFLIETRVMRLAHLAQVLPGLLSVQWPGVDVDRHCVRTFRQHGYPHRLLDAVAYVKRSLRGVLQALVKVDGGIEGGAVLPQPHHLVVLLLGLRGAFTRVVRTVPAIVAAVGEQVEAPATARTLTNAKADGLLHEKPSGLLELALCQFGNFPR